MRVTRRISGCDDGTCPAVYETDDPAIVLVQGSVIADLAGVGGLGPVPAGETVIAVPREIVEGASRDGGA